MMTFATKFRTRIGTWNVRTLHQPGRTEQLSKEALRLNIPILGLSEVRWTEFGEETLNNEHTLLYSGLQGDNAPHEKGVGFLLNRHAYSSLMEWTLEWTPVYERIIVARLKSRI